MSLVDYIPGARGLEAIAFGVVLTAVVGAMGVWHHEATKARAALATEQAIHARDLALGKAAALAGELAAKTETDRRAAAQKEIDNESQRLASRARDTAVAAARADAGLRNAFAAAAPRRGAGPGNSAAVAVGSATGAADVVRTDVFGRLDDRAGELAKAFDLAYVAGVTCEREHDSLKK